MTQIELNNTTIQRPDWLSEEVWPFRIRTVDLDGTLVAYTDEGEGPTLLLVHDGMWSYIWGQLISRLRSGFRVITLDFPGSGLSPDSRAPPSLEGDSLLLESFAERLGLSDVTLVLHDLGGGVGVGLAARRPELIKGMVMVNSFAWPPDTRSFRAMLRIMTSRPVTALNVGTNLVPRLSTTSFGIGRHLDEASRKAFVGPYAAKGPRRRFHHLMNGALAERDYLAKLDQALKTTLAGKPVLTIFGEKNDQFGFQARFKDYFPDSDEMVIPKGHHFPMCDDPEGVAERITTWHSAAVA